MHEELFMTRAFRQYDNAETLCSLSQNQVAQAPMTGLEEIQSVCVEKKSANKGQPGSDTPQYCASEQSRWPTVAPR